MDICWRDKAWGRTRCLIDSDLFSRHELEVKAGGFCSVHYHTERANRFIVQAGEIVVLTLMGQAILHEVTLTADMQFDVPSMLLHCFLVLSEGKLLEDYWPDRGGTVRNEDIVRLSHGGHVLEEYDVPAHEAVDRAIYDLKARMLQLDHEATE